MLTFVRTVKRDRPSSYPGLLSRGRRHPALPKVSRMSATSFRAPADAAACGVCAYNYRAKLARDGRAAVPRGM